MSTQYDLLNGSNNKLERLASEVPVNTQMCSNWQDDSDEMFPYWQDDTCGDHSLDVKKVSLKSPYSIGFCEVWALLQFHQIYRLMCFLILENISKEQKPVKMSLGCVAHLVVTDLSALDECLHEVVWSIWIIGRL